MPTSYFYKCTKTAFLSVAAGAIIGASTNAINSYISPEYYQMMLGWDFEGIWAASIAQGTMEGVTYGVFFAFVVLASILIFRKVITWSKVTKHILKAVFLVYLSWLIGGTVALILASISPDFYMSFIHSENTEAISLSKFAWVAGSIKGAMFGGALSAIICAIAIKSDEPRLQYKAVA